MQFQTQFTHVSRNSGALYGKQEFRFRKNCFDNMVSDMQQKMTKFAIKLLFKTVQKTN